MADPQFLGDRLLPDSLRERRQNLRSRLQNLRQPIRQRREDLSPVNVVGMMESNIQDLRDRIISRTDVLTRIRNRRQGGGDGGGGNNSPSNQSVETDPSSPRPDRGRGDNVDQVM